MYFILSQYSDIQIIETSKKISKEILHYVGNHFPNPNKNNFHVHIPLGNGAKDLPQPFVTISLSSERTRWPSESVPQKKGTFPSVSCIRQTLELARLKQMKISTKKETRIRRGHNIGAQHFGRKLYSLQLKIRLWKCCRRE